MNNLEQLIKSYLDREIQNIGTEYLEYLYINFNKEQDGDGNKWAKKSEKTKKQYSYRGWNTNKTGIRKGDMKRSFILKTGKSNGWYIKISNLAPYSAFFNDGTTRMVARPFLYSNEKKLQSIIKDKMSNLGEKILKAIKIKIER